MKLWAFGIYFEIYFCYSLLEYHLILNCSVSRGGGISCSSSPSSTLCGICYAHTCGLLTSPSQACGIIVDKTPQLTSCFPAHGQEATSEHSSLRPPTASHSLSQLPHLNPLSSQGDCLRSLNWVILSSGLKDFPIALAEHILSTGWMALQLFWGLTAHSLLSLFSSYRGLTGLPTFSRDPASSQTHFPQPGVLPAL